MSRMILYQNLQRLPLSMKWFSFRDGKNKKGISGTVKDLAQSFNDRLTTLIAGLNISYFLDLAFNAYKPDSLKEQTRETPTRKAPVQHKI